MSWPVESGGEPIAITAIAAVSLTGPALVYVNGSGQLDYADATAEGKEAVGYINDSFAAAAVATYYNAGQMEGLSGLSTNVRYFMTTTPGVVGAIPSTTGNVVLCVGTAASATTLNFNLETPVTL